MHFTAWQRDALTLVVTFLTFQLWYACEHDEKLQLYHARHHAQCDSLYVIYTNFKSNPKHNKLKRYLLDQYSLEWQRPQVNKSIKKQKSKSPVKINRDGLLSIHHSPRKSMDTVSFSSLHDDHPPARVLFQGLLEPAPKPIAQVEESATGDVEAKWNLVQPRGKATKKSNTGAHSLDKT